MPSHRARRQGLSRVSYPVPHFVLDFPHTLAPASRAARFAEYGDQHRSVATDHWLALVDSGPVGWLPISNLITGVFSRAVEMLKGEPEHQVAARMLAELPARTEMLAARCTELPRLLATTQEAGTMLEWSA